jgi:hypothetical protein
VFVWASKANRRGKDVLSSRPTAIHISFLESRFPEMSEFRKARLGTCYRYSAPLVFPGNSKLLKVLGHSLLRFCSR